MSKSLAASKKLMQTYLSELLTEEEVEQKQALAVKEKQLQAVEKLLDNATFATVARDDNSATLSTTKALSKSRDVETLDVLTKAKAAKQAQVQTEAKTTVIEPVVDKTDLGNQGIKTRKSEGGFEAIGQRSYRQGDFQAMFFEVAGLMIAVPLIELGGIHNTDKTTPLMGKPDWFQGVMLYRDEKVNVVDTARWVMPEKCDEALISALNYQYIIMLSNSSWGLSAEKLVDTVTLKQEDVKWLDTPSKRPWLAGLVKNRMCALLDVESLIKLLEKGVNITQE